MSSASGVAIDEEEPEVEPEVEAFGLAVAAVADAPEDPAVAGAMMALATL